MKISEDRLAGFGAIQLGIEHLSLTQLRSHQLVRLLAGGPSLLGLVPSEVLLVLYILLSVRLYALVATFDAQCM